jgi:hypothetical protein
MRARWGTAPATAIRPSRAWASSWVADLPRAVALAVALLILLDGALNYLLLVTVGTFLPIAATAVPVTGLALLAPSRTGAFTFPFLLGVWLLAGGLVVGAASLGQVHHLLQAALSVATLVFGFLSRERWMSASDLRWLLLVAGSLHFLLGSLFLVGWLEPTEYKAQSMFGAIYYRPAYYIDQNFQLFYWCLIPLMLLTSRKSLLIVGCIVNAITIIMLLDIQTRSGLALFIIEVCCITFIRLIRDGPGAGVTLVLIFSIIVGMIILLGTPLSFLEKKIHVVLLRFADPVAGSVVSQRIASHTYLLEKLASPALLIPEGQAIFRDRTGALAHSAPTTVFLDGGLAALVGWSLLVCLPAARAARRLWRWTKEGATGEIAVTVPFITSLATALTLAAPFQKPLWLLAGIVTASLMIDDRSARRTSRPSGWAGQRLGGPGWSSTSSSAVPAGRTGGAVSLVTRRTSAARSPTWASRSPWRPLRPRTAPGRSMEREGG